MRVPTVKIKHPKHGVMIVNESDWALGSIPGVNLGSDWTRIGEKHGDKDEAKAVKAAKDQRKLVDAAAKNAENIEKRAKIAQKRKNAKTKPPLDE